MVEIYDQVYQLRGTDSAYIERLAAMVDALNIADELTTLRARYDALNGSLTQSQTQTRSRAGSLAGMLDEILVERKVG